jgi:hypothetical protein
MERFIDLKVPCRAEGEEKARYRQGFECKIDKTIISHLAG